MLRKCLFITIDTVKRFNVRTVQHMSFLYTYQFTKCLCSPIYFVAVSVVLCSFRCSDELLIKFLVFTGKCHDTSY